MSVLAAGLVVRPWSQDVVAPSATPPGVGATEPNAPTHPMFDESGELTMPLPQLDGGVSITANDDGSSQVSFTMRYAVANPGPGAPQVTVDGTTPPPRGTLAPAVTTPSGARPDVALVTVMVSPTVAPGGPIRLRPLTRQTTVDQNLTAPATTSHYSFRIPPNATRFLQLAGLPVADLSRTGGQAPATTPGSRGTAPAATVDASNPALKHIDIDVQQMRDYKVVDGSWDWQQGRAYTAADGAAAKAAPASRSTGPIATPAAMAMTMTDDSTITVTNNTNAGLFGPAANTAATSGDQPNETAPLLQGTSDYQTNISLAGTAVECVLQGSGSNPAGFSMLNGWDILDGLAPGVVPPGASVTEQVTADESLGTTSLDIAQESTTALVQVLAAVGGYTTPGLKSAVSEATLLAMGITEFGGPVTVALAVPVMAILGLVEGIYEAMTSSCASYANVFNVSAAEPMGSLASYSWGDQTNGLVSVFDSASFGGTAVTNNVQLAASTGIVSFLLNGSPATVHPYLEQVATTACGTGCSGSTNNVIDVQWSAGNPCPTTPTTNCLPEQSAVAGLPPVTVPGTSLCGPSNELCTTLPTPNSSASEVNAESASDFDDEPYEVVGQYQPASPVTALVAVDDTTVYGGSQDGSIYAFTPEGAISTVIQTAGPIGAMVLYQGQVVFSSGATIYAFTPGNTGSLRTLGAVGSSSDPVTRMSEVGGLVYLMTGMSMAALVSDWSINAVGVSWPVNGADAISMAAGPSFLYVGFEDGWVERCELTDCAGSWTQLHDGGFTSDANALTTVGDTVYIGLENGAIAQIDGVTGTTTMLSGAGSEGLAWGGMTTVNGNVYVGGCVGLQSPVSGDLLGVVTLEGVTEQGAQFAPEAPYAGTCQNPTETTTQYKGFDPSSYAMISTPATADHPPLVFASLSISSGNFVYALESVAPFTSALCLPDNEPCPTAPPPPPTPAAVPPPVGSVEALGTPLMVSTCGTPTYTATPPTVAGTTPSTGFQLTTPSSSSYCRSTFAWNLDNAGSLPYAQWLVNAYSTAGSPQATLSIGTSNQVLLPWTANPPQPSNGDETPVPTTGLQLSTPLITANALVLTISTPAGAPPTTYGFTADVLVATGSAPPPPVPLLGATPASTVTSSTAAGTTTTSAPTSTTTAPVPTTATGPAPTTSVAPTTTIAVTSTTAGSTTTSAPNSPP